MRSRYREGVFEKNYKNEERYRNKNTRINAFYFENVVSKCDPVISILFMGTE